MSLYRKMEKTLHDKHIRRVMQKREQTLDVVLELIAEHKKANTKVYENVVYNKAVNDIWEAVFVMKGEEE